MYVYTTVYICMCVSMLDIWNYATVTTLVCMYTVTLMMNLGMLLYARMISTSTNEHTHIYTCTYAIRPKNARNGTGAKGGLFQTLSDQISQLFSPLTSLAHWGCFVEF